MEALVAAVDVGTASARAGILDRSGRLLGRAVRPIELARPGPGLGLYDSEGIWAAVAAAVRAARAAAGVPPARVAGLAFDATCSLVLRDRDGRPLAPEGDAARWDTIAWFDHRARAEAAEATATGHPAVVAQGGALSPEMQVPKLMWLKRQSPAAWRRLGLALDLADFLCWRATGRPVRSRCPAVCKWGFEADGPDWPREFLKTIGLDDLAARCGLDGAVSPIGAPTGRLTAEAAAALGLTEAVQVAAGLVDAHAGALGVLAGVADRTAAGRRLALIVGTSSCVMGFAAAPRPARGFWGPYRDVALPGLWMSEGGQSASGALLDHLCRVWAGAEPGADLHDRVWRRIDALVAAEGPDLAPGLHVLPDFHGNRSPHADPEARGSVSGLGLDASFDGFCRLYWRAAIGIALGLRQVVEAMAAQGWPGEALHLAGGLGRSPLVPRLFADAIGLPVVLSEAPDPTLLGTAMAASCGAGLHPDLGAAARAMAAGTRTVAPDPAARPRMERDYAALLMQQRHRRELAALVAAARPGPAPH